MSATRDFTLHRYEDLSRALVSAGYPSLLIGDYIERPEARPERFVLLRHDVETDPPHALRLAEIEARHGLRATYFFRSKNDGFRPSVIGRLRDLGHEVGYHYETLARARGDRRRAIELFGHDLEALRRSGAVRVASMHGSPLLPWDNRAIWEAASPADFGLVGEVYRDIDYRDVRYFSDTGRTWHPTRHNLRDHVGAPPEAVIDTTEELIALVRGRRFPRLCLLAHPDRWSATTAAWAARAARDSIENAVKDVLRAFYGRRDEERIG